MSTFEGRNVFNVTAAILPARIQVLGEFTRAAVQRLEEMLGGLSKIRRPVKRLVVDEDSAEQRLLASRCRAKCDIADAAGYGVCGP